MSEPDDHEVPFVAEPSRATDNLEHASSSGRLIELSEEPERARANVSERQARLDCEAPEAIEAVASTPQHHPHEAEIQRTCDGGTGSKADFQDTLEPP